MKENNYITIPGFLRTRLDLKGSELIITALIYGYSQDGNSWFMGKTEYIAEWAGITDKNVLRSLKSLTEKGILEKKEIFVNNRAKRCYYRFNFECSGCQNSTVAGCQNSTVAGCQNSTVNNNIDNNIDNDNIKPGNGFPGLFMEKEKSENAQKLRGTTEPHKCLFANSRFSKFEEFEKCFDKPEFEQIDILYYYHSVADWSASKGRMQKDWIAQTRNFIRGDKEKGKLHLKPQYQQGKKGVDINGAMEFLNNDY